jgi:FKBP-type peptidyl-prolyl cis-trans isomerase
MNTFTTREWIATGLGVVAAIILFFGGSILNAFKGATNQAPAGQTASLPAETTSTGTTTSTAPSATSTKNTMQNISKTQGLEIYDEVVGTGAEAKAGQTIQAHYVGTLVNGTKFDSSVDRGQPFEFTLGVGQVIQGWDIGIQGMKVGGKRKLVISPELGYGARGAGNLIPPNATLIFEVQLVAVK